MTSLLSVTQAVITEKDALTHGHGALGGKALNLAKMTQMGFPVPPWFVVPTDVFVTTLQESGVSGRIQEILSQIDWANSASPREASAEIARLVKSVTIAPAVAESILKAYHSSFKTPLVAVRSSAVGEDSAAQSFAGQMDTFLFVQGDDPILESVRGCWASAFSERALVYRNQNGLGIDDIRIAVVIQEMIFGDVSGVLFTTNAISQNWDQAVLSATFGAGEGLVSGELDADHWVGDKLSRSLELTIAPKGEKFVFNEAAGRGIHKVEVAEELREKACLNDQLVWQIMDLGERIAEKYGWPQDIEWAVRGDEVFLLQTRPITTMKPRPSGFKRLWDNSNIAESYQGVTTPLTFSFVNRMYEIAYQVMFDAFGIPQKVLRDHHAVFANLLGILNGRIFYNLGNYYQIITFLPAYEYMKDFFDTMIGVQEKKDYEAKSSIPLWKKLFIGLPKVSYLVGKIGVRFWHWDRDVAEFQRHFEETFEAARRRRYADMNPDEILAAYRDLEDKLLWKWREPMVNDFFAMLFYGLLKKLTTQWHVDDTGSLQNDLLCGEGGLESTEPAKQLMRMAIAIKGDESLKKLFSQTSEHDLPKALEDPAYVDFKKRFDAYIDRYGYRCIGEMKLESKTLHDNPSFAYKMLKNYLTLENLDMESQEAQERAVRDRAEKDAAQKLSGNPLKKAFFWWVLKNARAGVRNRENLRMARTRAFGLVRDVFRGLGEQFASLGVLDNAEDVFCLDFYDIFAFVEGRSTCTNLKALAQLRRAEFGEYHAMPVDDRLETTGAVYYGGQLYDPASHLISGDTSLLQGTSCCPGQVKGIARVILSPDDDLNLNGEILVTERTDPGWVPLYPSVSGLLIERGSLLSHAAVVAREMGLPTIIGVKNLTRIIQDGQMVEVDARAGTVKLDVE